MTLHESYTDLSTIINLGKFLIDLLIHNIPVKNMQPVQYPICQWWEDMKVDENSEKP